MVKSTIIARVADGLPLAASMDDEEVVATVPSSCTLSEYSNTLKSMDLQEYKNQAKLLFKKLNQSNESKCSIESGPYIFQLSHPSTS